ncbi:MAG: hypothetical protein AAGF11_38880 [Myxococcota bacterium]
MAHARTLAKLGTLLAIVMVALVVSILLLTRALDRSRSGPSTTSASYLEDSTSLVLAFEAEMGDSWIESARKLKISSNSAELITQRDGIARRYTTGGGSILRRGGAYLVAAEPFDLGALKIELVPRLVAEAQERSGATIRQLVVGRDEQGLLLWRAIPKGGAADVYFTADGTYVPDPDDP